MPPHVFRVIFDDFAVLYNAVYLSRSNQPIRARHLPDGMRQEQETLGRRL